LAVSNGEPPFVLLAVDGGRFELRAFSDDSPDPIVLSLNHEDGRALSLAVAEVLTSLDAPGVQPRTVTLTLTGRRVTVAGTDKGLRLTVRR
jgi:hypothetical protein